MKDLIKKLICEEYKRIQELGANTASRAFAPKYNDQRSQAIRRDSITSLFSSYIGREIPFYIKLKPNSNPIRYDLIEVRSDEYATVLKLYFHNSGGIATDSPYSDNKKDLVFIYDVKTDTYDKFAQDYHYNRFAINFLIKAASIIRQIYYKNHPVYNYKSNRDGLEISGQQYHAQGGSGYYSDMEPIIDDEKTKEITGTKLKPSDFRQFPFDSKNLMNKNNINEGMFSSNINDLAKEVKKYTMENFGSLNPNVQVQNTQDKKQYIQVSLNISDVNNNFNSMDDQTIQKNIDNMAMKYKNRYRISFENFFSKGIKNVFNSFRGKTPTINFGATVSLVLKRTFYKEPKNHRSGYIKYILYTSNSVSQELKPEVVTNHLNQYQIHISIYPEIIN